MPRRAHCDFIDDCQCEAFVSVIVYKKLTFPFQVANTASMYIALPTIQKEMNLEPVQAQWVVCAYPLSSVSEPNIFTLYFLSTLSGLWTLLTAIYKNSRAAFSSCAVDSQTCMG